MTAPYLQELARICAERMLNCTAEGVVIALFAALLLRVLGLRNPGRRNPSTRFAVWFVTLLAIGVLPLLGILRLGAGDNAVRAGNSASFAIRLPAVWAVDIIFVWAIIAAAALLRVALGLWQLRKLRLACVPIKTLDLKLQRTLQHFASSRHVTVSVSENLSVPTAMGFFKPVIVFPAWAMREMSSDELNSILIHELAHLRRWDDWTNLTQKILQAIFFFHPAVWWIQSKLSLEREMACDDVVVGQTANPRAYAQCLISVAEKSFMRRSLALAQAAVNRMRHTSLRVSQILAANRSSAVGVWKPAMYLVGAVLAISVFTVSRTPGLVAFEDQIPVTAAAVSTVPTAATGRIQIVDHESIRAVPVLASLKTVSHPAVRPAARRLSVRKAVARTGAAHKTQQPNRLQHDFEIPKSVVADSATTPGLGSENIIQAKAESENALQPSPQTLLLVVQTEQYGPSGRVSLTFSVWRVSVLALTPTPVNCGIRAKSI